MILIVCFVLGLAAVGDDSGSAGGQQTQGARFGHGVGVVGTAGQAGAEAVDRQAADGQLDPGVSDLVRLFGLALAENFGYRQLNAWWRLQGTFAAIRGKEGWGKMTRKGFTTLPAPEDS